MLQPLTPIKANPVQGGAVTVRNPAQLPFGSHSMVQNIRGKHPNFVKRAGQRPIHTTSDGSNEVITIHQFKKSQVDENYIFAQMSDGDVLAATNEPPTITTGPFGDEVFDGSEYQVPAAWSVQGDKLIMSNGVDQHQIYCGVSSYVEKFVVYEGTSTIPDIPEIGKDYSTEVRNQRTNSYAVLGGVNSIGNYNCIYICTPVPAKAFGFKVLSANSNAVTAGIQYNNSFSEWVTVADFSDGTLSGGATLAQDGTMSFTAPSIRVDDESPGLISKYQFGKSGFWYRLVFSGALSSVVNITTATFESDFQDIINIWDGVPVYAVEAQVEHYEALTFHTYGSGAVDIGGFGFNTNERLMVACSDPVEGFYFDVGNTPNEQEVEINSISYFDGSGYTSVGDFNDGTGNWNGTKTLSKSGWVTFKRQKAYANEFQTAPYAYWYEITFTGTLTSEVVVAISIMPFFDVRELGVGQCNTTWKDRVIYSFDQYPSYIYLAKRGQPLMLNGTDYGILRAGDGRSNKIAVMKSYKDFLMVWQREEGVEGGCVTLFSGSTPVNITRTVLSSRIGAMNAKCVEVVEGVETATADKATSLEDKIATLVFFLSVKGVCVSNGYTISIISDDIQNYFDPTKPESIRRGYEDKMWLKYDSAYGILRLGLVTGSLATRPNLFPVYDLADKTWSFDVLGQELSCMAECEAGSGNIPTLQLGGGKNDGTIHQLNYGLNDGNVAIDSFSQMELNYNGEIIVLEEFMVRFAAQDYGEIIIEIIKNNLAETFRTVSMLPEKPGQIISRDRFNLNISDQNITIKISAGEFNTEMELVEIGMKTNIWSDA